LGFSKTKFEVEGDEDIVSINIQNKLRRGKKILKIKIKKCDNVIIWCIKKILIVQHHCC